MKTERTKKIAAERTLLHAEGVAVEGILPTGAGRATIDGCTVVIPGALPGSVVDIEWRPPMPGGRQGLAERVLERSPSPDAAPDACPLAVRCGGCPMGRIRFEKALQLKVRDIVAAPLAAEGFAEARIVSLLRRPKYLPSEARRGFRNKAIFHPAVIDGRVRLGLFEAASHCVVPAEDCPQNPSWMHDAAHACSSLLTKAAESLPLYDETTGDGLVRALLLREGPGKDDEAAGSRLACLVLKTTVSESVLAQIRAAFAPLGLLQLSINIQPAAGNAVLSFSENAMQVLEGPAAIDAWIDGLVFEVRADTFLQVNTPLTPVLYREALDALDLTDSDLFLDLYCGVGTMTPMGARKAARSAGIAIVEPSVACAERNAARNGIENVRFFAGPVEKVLTSADFTAWLKSADGMPVKAIVDPAYRGLAAVVPAVLGNSPVERLVYVACSPKNFARDAHRLEAHGFRLMAATPIDLFPGACHMEVVGVFERA